MKKKEKVKKEKKLKGRISKRLLRLAIISFLLLFFGIFIFRHSEHQIALSIIIATIPYGYDLLDFLNEERFSMFGKLDFIVSIIVRVVLGAFIGVAASVVVIGKYLLEDIQI